MTVRILLSWVVALGASVAFGVSLEELVDTRHGAVSPEGKVMSGRCLLGPCTPNGAIAPGPDTLFPQRSQWKYPSPSGYHPSDEVVGFSQLHAHGTGGHPTYGLFLVSPTTGTSLEETDLASLMKLVTTRPSLFACELTRPRTRVEITAGRQTALYRFRFPPDARKLGEASCSFGKARHVMETTMS